MKTFYINASIKCNGKLKHCVKILSKNTKIYHCSNEMNGHDHYEDGYDLCIKCVTQLCVCKIVLNKKNCDNELESKLKSESDHSNENTNRELHPNEKENNNNSRFSNQNSNKQENDTQSDIDDQDIDIDIDIDLTSEAASNTSDENSAEIQLLHEINSKHNKPESESETQLRANSSSNALSLVCEYNDNNRTEIVESHVCVCLILS